MMCTLCMAQIKDPTITDPHSAMRRRTATVRIEVLSEIYQCRDCELSWERTGAATDEGIVVFRWKLQPVIQLPPTASRPTIGHNELERALGAWSKREPADLAPA